MNRAAERAIAANNAKRPAREVIAEGIARNKAKEANPWRCYVDGKEINQGDWLAYMPVGGQTLVKVKFVSVESNGQNIITGSMENDEFKSLPVSGFYGVEIKRPAGTIDLTPTWAAILPILIESLGNPNQKANAVAELERMAKAADLYNKYCSGGD